MVETTFHTKDLYSGKSHRHPSSSKKNNKKHTRRTTTETPRTRTITRNHNSHSNHHQHYHHHHNNHNHNHNNNNNTTNTIHHQDHHYHYQVPLRSGLLFPQFALRLLVLQMAELAAGALHARSMDRPDAGSFAQERMPHAAPGNAFRPVLRRGTWQLERAVEQPRWGRGE